MKCCFTSISRLASTHSLTRLWCRSQPLRSTDITHLFPCKTRRIRSMIIWINAGIGTWVDEFSTWYRRNSFANCALNFLNRRVSHGCNSDVQEAGTKQRRLRWAFALINTWGCRCTKLVSSTKRIWMLGSMSEAAARNHFKISPNKARSTQPDLPQIK